MAKREQRSGFGLLVETISYIVVLTVEGAAALQSEVQV